MVVSWMRLGCSFARLRHKGSDRMRSITPAWWMCLAEQGGWRKHMVLLEACR
uniref:Uncharacterized protein n=1 Tax=Arundo donax TaxID=35708 RepID=A0A0A8Y3V1_ARUDO